MGKNTFDVSEVNNSAYIIDIQAVALTLSLKGKTYLSCHRKMKSMKNADYDMKNSYFLAYTREDKDKNNYLYTFYLYCLPSTFSMDKYRKYFYTTLKTFEEIQEFLKLPLSEVNETMRKLGIWEEIFHTERDYEKFKEELNKLMEDPKFKNNKDPYFLSALILFATIETNLSQYPFKDNVYEKKEVLLKKKSEDKIISTYSNKLFHLAMYGEDMTTFSLK